MATKSKSNASSKGKTTASKNAQQRAQAQNHLSEAPAVTRSNRAVDQNRAAPESPLQGADRPATGRHGKVNRTDSTAGRKLTGRTPINEGERVIRRVQRSPDRSSR